MGTSEEKHCNHCHKLLSLASFHKKGAKFDSRCKSCISKAKRRLYRRKVAESKKKQKDIPFEIFVVPAPGLGMEQDQIVDLLEGFLLEEGHHGECETKTTTEGAGGMGLCSSFDH